MKLVYRFLTQLSSRKRIAQLCGRVAKSSFSKRLIPHFAKTYQININEAEKDLRDYPTLNAFFVRRMKKECRPIESAQGSVVSPVDGRVVGIGKIEDGVIFNVKEQTYTLDEMLAHPHYTEVFRNGQYVVLYLSPTNYHRIHSPISGKIEGHHFRAGTVFPVNKFGLRYMKKVLSRNARLITYVKNEYTESAIVKVGAMNVSSIKLSDRLISKEVGKGDELAYFEFGSTVVLLFKGSTVQFNSTLTEGADVKMGEGIGKLRRGN